MPFKSKAQQRYMFSQHPQLAKEMADKTPNMKGLPNRVTKSSKSSKSSKAQAKSKRGKK